MITVLGRGDGRISDVDALKKVHLQSCRMYLPSPDAKVEQTLFKVPEGIGFRSTFVDPDLVGKPSKPGDYKVVTPALIRMDNGVIVHVTLFTDDVSGPTFQEALQMVESVKLPPPPANAAKVQTTDDALIVSVAVLDAQIRIPKEGFSESQMKLNQAESYFSFSRKDGVIISGWLEPVANYQGFKKLWATDKEKMSVGINTPLTEEKFETIDGWNAVTYTLGLPGGGTQKNLRACRTWGHTWVDVHLSLTRAPADTESLRTLLRALKVEARQAEVAAR
ncbi:MAG: hypothetical protein QM760_02620 [Nibricoccus sp.]